MKFESAPQAGRRWQSLMTLVRREVRGIAQNVARGDDVDAFMIRAETAGARILTPAGKTFWGGCNGYFADADGHVWEIAYNPFWELADGSVRLPD